MREKEFNGLCESIKEMGQIIRGEKKPSRIFYFPETDIKAIRKRLKTSQAKFASMIGVNVGTLRNWEQGIRRPQGPARVLLKVAEKNPKAIIDALHTV